MKIIDRLFQTARRRYGQRGSALLVSLMIMVGLSLLGLSFVAISETESAISAHERDGDQTLDVAEAGAKMVVEWFQDPDWADSKGLLPANDTTIKTRRHFISNGTELQNYYKDASGGTFKLFDKPFANPTDRFFGTETTADIIIDYSTSVGRNFLNNLNQLMLTTNATATGNPQNVEGGGIRITEIRVFAPPIIGGNINQWNFWDNTGTPYGLATIKVTAKKFGINDVGRTDLSNLRALSTRYVKIVVAPWPFPGPQGPIQSNANINTGGAVGVHWGKMTSEGFMYIKNPLTSMNWYDAWDRAHIEHGYLSSAPWQANHAYEVGDVVHPTAGTDTKIDGTTIVWECTTAGTSGAGEPTWTSGSPQIAAPATVKADNSVQWTARYPKAFQNNSNSGTADQYNWLYQILGKTYEDPWFEARSRGAIINTQNNQFQNAVGAAATDPQPLPYDSPTKDPVNIPDYGYSCWFQNQTVTDPKPSHRKQVVFPRIDYNFWKDIAVSGAGTQGVYYLQWVSGINFTDGVSTKNMAQWVNTVRNGQPGFYFFDTQNKQNPQGPGAAGILTPDINLTSGLDGNTFQMQGFIYLNCTFGTNGIGGPDGYQNYPGEPYRDVGYRDVALANIAADASTTPPTIAQTKGTFTKDASGNPVWDSVGDGLWTFQDLPWSNTGTDGSSSTATVGNGKPDIYIKQRNIRLADGTQSTVWMPVDWYPGCHPGDNQSLVATDPLNCSEPHEPYLNLQYYNAGSGISRARSSPSTPQSIAVGWVDPSTEIYLKKKLVSGVPVASCNYAGTYDWWQACTSNAYDRDGPLVDDIKPVLNGVLYMEGNMNSQGNASYFGSVLINGSVDDQGTPDVWFDESLIKNTWPPSSLKFPRVYVSSIQTDQQ